MWKMKRRRRKRGRGRSDESLRVAEEDDERESSLITQKSVAEQLSLPDSVLERGDYPTEVGGEARMNAGIYIQASPRIGCRVSF